MECINHRGVPAVGTCNVCGKGLCAECASRFETPLCESCLLKHNSSIETNCYIKLGITLLMFVGAGIWWAFSDEGNFDAYIFFAVIGVLVYWGKDVVSGPTGVVMDLKTYGIFSVFKFIFTLIAGLFLAPIGIFRCIREIVTVRRTQKDILSGKI